MRKRIILGLLAVVAIVVVALILLQPKKGSVEWHKREYLRAIDRIIAKDLGSRVKGLLARRTGMPLLLEAAGDPVFQADIAQLEMHERALREAGVLENRTFMLTNPIPGPAAFAAAGAARGVLPRTRTRLVVFKPAPNWATNRLTIVCPRQDASKWEELIRKADVP